ncbi:UNVERIFIED_CONTAM: hypothetical protein PYX00_010416 [Menopon gallinae]|uniref:C2H2-type domain-containing protein n=1 Tax=Menopon gallinae TaxID=328185 RepID=A0AAW2HFE5_9NEOP
MMDISDAMRGPIDGGGLANEADASQNESGEDAFDEVNTKNLKRKIDDDYINSKKRRKQLKPIRIATNLDDMEAYCELCKKEFCNKYFLKTHKANKHGIYVDFPSASSGKQKSETGTGKLPENGKTDPDCERAFCELCNKRFCNKYFVRRHKTKSHGLPDDENHYGLTCQDPEPNSVQNSTINSTKKNVSIVTTCDSLALIAKDEFDNQKQVDEQESPLNLIVKDGSDEEGPDEVKQSEKEDADDCSSENIEKLQTMLLRLNPSDVESKICKVCHEVTDGTAEHKCGTQERKEYLSEANDSSNESKNEFAVPKSDGHDFLYNRLDHLKQMKPTSSYCEICNKELCNKYFMRTHMQRMHGIEIEHGTQIGGVVCNICNKELCSKYFLRVHKQNTHGIVSPNSLVGPSTSGNLSTARVDVKTSRSDPRYVSNFSQVCYICNKRFRSPKWLQAHFLSDHRDEVRQIPSDEPANPEEDDGKDEEAALKIPKKSHGPEPPEALDVISKLFWENNSSSKSYNCSQCPFTTSVLAFLFVHERSHYVLSQDQTSDASKPPISLQSLLHDQSFWQHKITQQLSECLDLSSGKSKYLSFEQNGS